LEKLVRTKINAKDSSWLRNLKGVWRMEEWGRNFETVVSGKWKTGKKPCFGKMFGWATKI